AATLSHALRTNRIAPAYLFSGPRGTGKTSSARILARSLNCQSHNGPTPEPCGSCELCLTIAAGTALDVIEIDAASNTGVDNIRELIERSRFAPVQARWKVYVVDECHMLSTAAFNALLKTLEEPPPQVVFVLATTDPQRVLPTILSRCQRFDFRRIPLEALEQHLTMIASREDIDIRPEALHVVAQRAQGGLRDAESLLDQLSLLPGPIEATAVWELLGAVPEQELLELANSLATGDALKLLESCRRLLDRGRDPGAVLQGLATVLRDLVLMAAAPDRPELTSVSPQFRNQLPTLASQIGRRQLLQWQAQLKGSESQLRHSVQPRLWLEVLLLGLLAETPAPSQTTTPKTETTTATAINTARVNPNPSIAPAASEAAAGVSQHDQPRASSETANTSAPGTSSTSERPPTEGSTSTDDPATTEKGSSENLAELWQQILGSLELPSTRMLLSQQAQLVRLDAKRAVVQVAGNWMGMVQSRASLLDQAITKALGSPRQLVLENHSGPGHAAPGIASQTAPTSAAPTTAAPPAAIPQTSAAPTAFSPTAISPTAISPSTTPPTTAPPTGSTPASIPPISAGPSTSTPPIGVATSSTPAVDGSTASAITSTTSPTATSAPAPQPAPIASTNIPPLTPTNQQNVQTHQTQNQPPA
ncbi:MAG: DNA polymerase III subunit gamma/tau, partial [Prochlorococcus sp.]|nr:DNA polymerase III subunit gamma/tau [Prochlorococcus sp.]